jgi:hypothetical protein
MHAAADSALFPFAFECFDRYRRNVPLGISAGAPIAHQEVSLNDANGLLFTVTSGNVCKNVRRHQVYSTLPIHCEATSAVGAFSSGVVKILLITRNRNLRRPFG